MVTALFTRVPGQLAHSPPSVCLWSRVAFHVQTRPAQKFVFLKAGLRGGCLETGEVLLSSRRIL